LIHFYKRLGRCRFVKRIEKISDYASIFFLPGV